MATAPIDVAVVASWYPSIQDHVAGRFVADQVEALAATGAVRPSVLTFEPADLIGAGVLRDRLARLVGDLAAAAVANDPALFAARGQAGPAGVPVARLTITSGRHPAAGGAHGAVARDRALGALAARWRSTPRPGDPPLPALVHAHTAYPDGAGAVTLADALDRPLVITEHSSFVDRLLAQPAVRERYVAAVNRAAMVIVVSRTLARELVAAIPELGAKHVVIPNAVAVDAFTPAPLAGRRPDELLFVGYLKETKGIETLLAAVARLRTTRPEITLRCIGGSPTAEIGARWEREARGLGIADVVRFDPAADRAGVAEAMARAWLFVHPSPRETFGVVAAEALASGLPVVATDSGGVTEILGDDPARLGAVVPPRDPEALAAAIDATLARRESFDPAVLREAVVARFGGTAVAGRLVELYSTVLDGTRRPGAPPAVTTRAAVPAEALAEAPRRIVVAFDPARAAVMDLVPDAVRATTIVVTSSGAPGPRSLGLAGLEVTDLHGRAQAVADASILGPRGGTLRRILRALRHPLAVARRRGLLPGLETLVRERGTPAVRGALQRSMVDASIPGGSPVLICVDGIDHLAAEPLIASGEARLAAGGIRHLADLSSDL
jgi:glycogen(starch) synthase